MGLFYSHMECTLVEIPNILACCFLLKRNVLVLLDEEFFLLQATCVLWSNFG